MTRTAASESRARTPQPLWLDGGSAPASAAEGERRSEGGEEFERFGTQSHETTRERFARVEKSKGRDGREDQPEEVGLKALKLETSFVSNQK